MLAAVEAWVRRDHPAEWRTCLLAGLIANRVAAIDGVKTAVREPTDLDEPEPVAGDHVGRRRRRTSWGTKWPRNWRRPSRGLRSAPAGGGRAAQAAAPGTTGITITAWQMQPGDDQIVAERVHAVLSRKRPPRTTAMPAPAGDVVGRWNVAVEFFSSRSQHTL